VLEQALARLEALTGLPKIPAPRTGPETDLFDALTIIFLEPRLSERARNAVRCAFGEQKFEILVAYLAFIRTAHYWTETHRSLHTSPTSRRLCSGTQPLPRFCSTRQRPSVLHKARQCGRRWPS
jgi:hypothetical protein